MNELDGIWRVQRVSGALPPLVGVRKRIGGDRGETIVPGLPGVPFTVDGLTLRYKPPLDGLVDHLERDEEGFRGRATFLGREYGRFLLRPVEVGATAEGGPVGEPLRKQLLKHIDEAAAMEQYVLRLLESAVATTSDPEIAEALRTHRAETEQHAERLVERLEAHGASPSVLREAGGVAGALLKSVVDLTRPEKAGRNARDAYAAEHMEIAAYELLERVARRAGDEETAEVARRNRADEEAMAARLEGWWDRFVDLSLQEAGVAGGAVR